MYLSKFQKCICLNFKMYLSKFQNVFVKISKCICPNCKMYLFILQNVFVQIILWSAAGYPEVTHPLLVACSEELH